MLFMPDDACVIELHPVLENSWLTTFGLGMALADVIPVTGNFSTWWQDPHERGPKNKKVRERASNPDLPPDSRLSGAALSFKSMTATLTTTFGLTTACCGQLHLGFEALVPVRAGSRLPWPTVSQSMK